MGVKLNRGDVLWFSMDAVVREFGISAARTFPQEVVATTPWTCETVHVGTVTIPIEEAVDRGIVRVSRSQDG